MYICDLDRIVRSDTTTCKEGNNGVSIVCTINICKVLLEIDEHLCTCFLDGVMNRQTNSSNHILSTRIETETIKQIFTLHSPFLLSKTMADAQVHRTDQRKCPTLTNIGHSTRPRKMLWSQWSLACSLRVFGMPDCQKLRATSDRRCRNERRRD